jgi:hypothetical protein
MDRSHCEVLEGEDVTTKHLAEVFEEAIAPVMKKPTLAESVSEHVRESGVPDVVVTNTATGHNTPNTAVTATTDGPAAGPATGPMGRPRPVCLPVTHLLLQQLVPQLLLWLLMEKSWKISFYIMIIF